MLSLLGVYLLAVVLLPPVLLLFLLIDGWRQRLARRARQRKHARRR